MKKATQRLTAILFCLFIGGFGVLHILLPDRQFSEVENRYLAQFPTFSWEKLKDGTYTAGIETYLEDQFPFRDRQRLRMGSGARGEDSQSGGETGSSLRHYSHSGASAGYFTRFPHGETRRDLRGRPGSGGSSGGSVYERNSND